MKTSQVIALLCFSAATVAALPPPVRPVAPREPQQDAGAQANNNDCASAQQLADGIDDNITVQKQEQTEAEDIRKTVSSDNVDRQKFQSAKEKLLSTVNKGISIRESNEKIASAGNKSVPGLKTIANVQTTELSQVESLRGDMSDAAVLSQLEEGFSGAIQQNQNNKVTALTGCA